MCECLPVNAFPAIPTNPCSVEHARFAAVTHSNMLLHSSLPRPHCTKTALSPLLFAQTPSATLLRPPRSWNMVMQVSPRRRASTTKARCRPCRRQNSSLHRSLVRIRTFRVRSYLPRSEADRTAGRAAEAPTPAATSQPSVTRGGQAVTTAGTQHTTHRTPQQAQGSHCSSIAIRANHPWSAGLVTYHSRGPSVLSNTTTSCITAGGARSSTSIPIAKRDTQVPPLPPSHPPGHHLSSRQAT